VAALLGALATAVYGTHVAHGGFYNDDWDHSVRHHFGAEGGVVGFVAPFTFISFRPVAVLYLPATHALFGTDPAPHLAWALAMAVAMSAALFALLRTLGMERLHAGLIAGLLLLFPASDASRLWAAAATALPAIALYLAGTTVAIRGLRATGRRSFVLHGVALVLYLLSVMTYEVAAGAMLMSVLAYRLAAGWRRAASRWAADLAVLTPVLLLVTANTWNAPEPASVQAHHAWTIAEQATTILARSALPFGAARTAPVCGALAAVALAGAITCWVLPRADAARAALRRWLLTAAASVLAVAAGYLTFIPGDPQVYSPLREGQFNRVNVLAAIGYVMLVYSLAMVAGLVAFRGRPRWHLASSSVAVLAGVLLAAGYAQEVRADIAVWDRAAAAQDQVVDTVASLLPDPPHGSVLYTFGHPTSFDGVPVFAASWDLVGAVQTRWTDPSLRGFPAIPGTTMACGATGVDMRNDNAEYGDSQAAPYGSAYLIDVAARRIARVDDAASCAALVPGFVPAGG
jgi:hypothetical protein